MKLIFALVLICTFGALMVYSASGYMCSQKALYNYDSTAMLKKQVGFMAVGFVVIFLVLWVQRFWDIAVFLRRWAIFIYIAGCVSVILLKTPLGVSSHGATRWIRIGGIQFQVAEIVKIAVIIILSYMVIKYSKSLKSWQMTVQMWCAGGLPAILLLALSNDLSSSVVVLAIVFGTTWITNRTHLLHGVVLGGAFTVVGGYVLYIRSNMPTQEELANMSFRVGRIVAWLEPERYSSDQAYQVLNSLYAIGSGGLFGKGIGMSRMKLGPIPEAQNDMIFAIIVEELGIFGGTVLIALFMYILYLLFRIMIKANHLYETTFVLGVFLHVGIQAFFNMGVATNLLPNTGIGLPFISYGGTSVFCLLCEMAIVCLIAKKNYVKSMKKE